MLFPLLSCFATEVSPFNHIGIYHKSDSTQTPNSCMSQRFSLFPSIYLNVINQGHVHHISSIRISTLDLKSIYVTHEYFSNIQTTHTHTRHTHTRCTHTHTYFPYPLYPTFTQTRCMRVQEYRLIG